MQNENNNLSIKQIGIRSSIMVGISILIGIISSYSGLGGNKQVLAISIFTLIISATLVFWNFRLAIAFIGMAIILAGNVITLEEFINSAELDIILFIVGMMIMVGVLKDLGLFSWIIQSIIKMKRMTGYLFIVINVFMSAIMSCLVGEVTSIVFMLALIFQVCDTLKVSPTPHVFISVIATNIGSSGTMLGNPVGILIGTKAGFTFIDFMITAFPIMLISLAGALAVIIIWYKKEIRLFTERLEARRKMLIGLGPLIQIPYKKGLFILIAAVALIAIHHIIELRLGVAKNTLLIVAPLAISGILMIWKNERARYYVESEVEWWTLLFFMMLFAVAGSLERTGVTQQLALDFTNTFGNNPIVLSSIILFITAIGSAFVDNVVFVAAFMPIIKELGIESLWWALIFGACFGGNVTLIGSTANIVALGMIEKRYHSHISFMEWFRFGAVIGLTTCIIACGIIILIIIF